MNRGMYSEEAMKKEKDSAINIEVNGVKLNLRFGGGCPKDNDVVRCDSPSVERS